MRWKGTNEQSEERRPHGLALLAEGKTSKEVAEILDVTKRSVDRWQAEAKKPRKKKAARAPEKIVCQAGETLGKGIG
jgi:transposase